MIYRFDTVTLYIAAKRTDTTKITQALGILIKKPSPLKITNRIGKMNGPRKNDTAIDVRDLEVILITMARKTIDFPEMKLRIVDLAKTDRITSTIKVR